MPSPLDVIVERSSGAPLVRIASQYAVPARFTCSFEHLDDLSSPVCHMSVAVRDGRPLCEALSLELGSDGQRIDGEDLRRIPVRTYMRLAIDQVAMWILPAPDPDSPLFIEGQQWLSERFDDEHIAIRLTAITDIEAVKALLRPQRVSGAVTDETLLEVADVYRRTHAAGAAPTAAVAQEWNVSRSTASRWIRRAREAGHLGRARARAAGEDGPPVSDGVG